MAANDVLNTNLRPLFKSGAWEMRRLPMKESVAMAAGSAINGDLAGEYTICDGSDTNIEGILMEDIASTDSDYATARKRKLCAMMLRNNAEFEFGVGAGTFTTADESKVVTLHSDGKSVAVDSAGTAVRIKRYLSATRGVGTFNPAFSQT